MCSKLCPECFDSSLVILTFEQYQLQECKHFVIIIRDGLKKICEWLPYLKIQLSKQFIQKRYQPQGNRATLHTKQFKQLEQIVYDNQRERSICIAKPILLSKIKSQDNQNQRQQVLEGFYSIKIEDIVKYLNFVTTLYQESVLVLYRQREMGFALKYRLLNVSNLIKFLSYQDLQDIQLIQGTVVMIEPLLRGEEEQLKALLQKLIRLKVKIQYVYFSLSEETKEFDSNYIYPDIFEDSFKAKEIRYYSESVQQIEIIEKQEFVKQRNTIVYFDADDYNIQNICIDIDNLDTTYEQQPQINNNQKQKKQNFPKTAVVEQKTSQQKTNDKFSSIKVEQGIETRKFESFVIFTTQKLEFKKHVL